MAEAKPLTLAEAALEAGYSETQFRRLIPTMPKGLARQRRPGCKFFFDPSRLKAWLDSDMGRPARKGK